MDEEKSGKESLVKHGVFKTDTSDGLMIQRLIKQRERVRNLIESENLKYIAMEAPHFFDFNTELLYALNMFIQNVFLDTGCFVIFPQPFTIKKYAYPEMNPQEVTKNHMVHQAKMELGLQGKRLSEHVADAYFACKLCVRFYQWHVSKILKDSNLSDNERDYFCGKHTFVKGIKKGITEYTGLIYRENDQFFDYEKYSKKEELNELKK